MRILLVAALLEFVASGSMAAANTDLNTKPPMDLSSQQWDLKDAPKIIDIRRRIGQILASSRETISADSIEAIFGLKFQPSVTFPQSLSGPASVVYKAIAGQDWFFSIYYVDSFPSIRRFNIAWPQIFEKEIESKFCLQELEADEDISNSGWRLIQKDRMDGLRINHYRRRGDTTSVHLRPSGCVDSISVSLRAD